MASRRDALFSILALYPCHALAAQKPARYKIDSTRSTVRLRVQVVGVGDVICEFRGIKGEIDYDPIGLSGSSQVQIETSTLKMLNYPFSWLAQSREFLDTNRFPLASFVSSELQFEGVLPAAIVGALTIKGVTRRERFEVIGIEQLTADAKQVQLRVEATRQLSRRQFDISGLSGIVNDLVKVELLLFALPVD